MSFSRPSYNRQPAGEAPKILHLCAARYLVACVIGFCAASVAAFAAGPLSSSSSMALFDAVKNGNHSAVRAMIDAKADVNVGEPDGATPLTWAVYKDDSEMVDLLLRAGANRDAANDYGVTAVSLACTNRNAEMVKKLVAAGANPNKAIWSGETPLMTCSMNGNVTAVGALLAHGADVRARESRWGQTALMWAIYEGHKDVARLLIEKGADVHAMSHMIAGHSPMIYDTYGGDVQASSKGGFSPLLFAAQQGDLETAALLLAKGAAIEERSPDDGTALVVATANGHEKFALFLLENGADANARDSSGITALHYALRSGIKSLYGMGDDPIPGVAESLKAEKREVASGLAAGGDAVKQTGANSKANVNQLLLQSSTKREASPLLPGPSMPVLVKALLARGADPNLQIESSPYRLRTKTRPQINLRGATPLLLAAAHADVQTMRALIEHRARPLVGTKVNEAELARKDYSDDSEFQGSATPLLVAAGLGRNRERTPADERMALEAVKMLVSLGADLNAANEAGWTPMHAASWTGSNSIVQYLAEKGAKLDVQNGCGQTPLSLAGGTSPLGLRVKLRPRKATVEVLTKLGAGAASHDPVGHCIPGRVPLLADLFGQ